VPGGAEVASLPETRLGTPASSYSFPEVLEPLLLLEEQRPVWAAAAMKTPLTEESPLVGEKTKLEGHWPIFLHVLPATLGFLIEFCASPRRPPLTARTSANADGGPRERLLTRAPP
jgi:hypothetical protein